MSVPHTPDQADQCRISGHTNKEWVSKWVWVEVWVSMWSVSERVCVCVRMCINVSPAVVPLTSYPDVCTIGRVEGWRVSHPTFPTCKRALLTGCEVCTSEQSKAPGQSRRLSADNFALLCCKGLSLLDRVQDVYIYTLTRFSCLLLYLPYFSRSWTWAGHKVFNK